MRYLAFATDYDETLADEGKVTKTTLAALEKLKTSGRKALLVTGRELPDLRQVFPEAERIFDAIVAENGALLWLPGSKEEARPLAQPPPAQFVERLRALGASPLSAGKVIVATRTPHEAAVLQATRELGLELNAIFNKGAVMVLPSGVNKGTGLNAALAALGLSRHNTVGCGDAENDHVFLSECELGVAVANALPGLRERADVVTKLPAGRGVTEVLEGLLADDLAKMGSHSHRHDVLLGTSNGKEVKLPASGARVLFAGPSGAGKSTAAKGYLERLIEAGYQCLVLDPEGDYETFHGAMVLGDAARAPSVEEVLKALEEPGAQLVVNLLGVALEDRPAFFASLLPRIQELRARTGRPHWLVVDETHHLLPSSWTPAPVTLSKRLDGLVLLTMRPGEVANSLLKDISVVVAVGEAPETTLEEFCEAVGEQAPPSSGTRLEPGEVLLWRRGEPRPVRVAVAQSRADHQRHKRKYAQGELAPDRSFYFRGPQQKMNLRAQNLTTFSQLADGVDEETWLHHLKQGDYSRWFRDMVKDEELAADAQAVEAQQDLPAAESRKRIRNAIERRYTLPGGAQPAAG